VAGCLQRLEGLRADRIAGHQPQRHGCIHGRPRARQQRHGVRGQHGLAAARGNAQTHAGHLAKSICLVRAARQRRKRLRSPLQARRTGETGQGVQGGLLVGLEGDGGHGDWIELAQILAIFSQCANASI